MSANSNYDISIVLVTYHNQSHIEQCITSLSDALTGYSSQLIIIDNDSRDQTVPVIRRVLAGMLSFQDTRFIVNEHNTGFTLGVNQGLEYCRGEYVLLLNPDLFTGPETFAVLFKLLAEGQADVVSPQFRFPDGRIQASCRRFPRKLDVWAELSGLSRIFKNNPQFNRWKMPDFDHCDTRPVDQPQGAFLLTTRRVMDKVGFLDARFPMFFSDVDWCRRVVENGFKILFTADVFVVHLQGASVHKKRAQMIVSSHRSFVDYFLKYDRTPGERLATRMLNLFLLLALLPRILLLQVDR